jgi:hypothetical protein
MSMYILELRYCTARIQRACCTYLPDRFFDTVVYEALSY